MDKFDIPSGGRMVIDREYYRVLVEERNQLRVACDNKDAAIASLSRQNQGAFQDKVHIDRAEFERLEAQAKNTANATLRASIAEDKIDMVRRARDDAKERARRANIRADKAEAAVRESERKMDKFKISGGCDACQAGKQTAENALAASKRDQQALKDRIAKAQQALDPIPVPPLATGGPLPSTTPTFPSWLTEDLRRMNDNNPFRGV